MNRSPIHTYENEILSGAFHQWRIQKLMAQGDAGELYWVESILDGRAAILKRPNRSAFPADIQRQASQIEVEAELLKALRGFKIDHGNFVIRVATLVDQSLPGTESTSHYFIVLENAPGIALGSLARLARFGSGKAEAAGWDFPQNLMPFMQMVEKSGEIPRLVLLRTIRALFDLFESIHSWKASTFEGEIGGVLWNDVKPDHIFWNPAQTEFTLIDWGNGQFLDNDGISKDRRYSHFDDYRQFFEEIGRLLSDASPDLFQELNWPASSFVTESTAPEIQELKEKLAILLQNETGSLLDARQRENYLLSTGAPNIDKLYEISITHNRILSFGELPDYNNADELYLRSAALQASQGNLSEFIKICRHALGSIPLPDPKWKVLDNMANIAAEEVGNAANLFIDALRLAVNNEWPEAHWRLCQASLLSSDPNRWPSLSAQIRRMVPEIANDIVSPYRAATRLLQGLQDELRRLENQFSVAAVRGEGEVSEEVLDLQDLSRQISILETEIIAKWTEIDPPPPGSGLTYAHIDKYLEELRETLTRLGIDPNIRLAPLKQALLQPKAQTAIIMDTWKAKGYRTAMQSLRYLLLWDPDRLRVLRAEQAIQKAQAWLEDVRQGPSAKEKVMEYAIRMEHTGRLIRNQIGNAPWIDALLSIFARLRTGIRPSDIVLETPAVINDFPWLKHFERKPDPALDPKLAAQTAPARAYRQQIPLAKDGKLGHGEDIVLGVPLDTWVPEARGSSARVFSGILRVANGKSRQAAIKIMRPDKVDYASPLFWEEVQVLSVVDDLPGVSGWLECGFLQFDNNLSLPTEASSVGAGDLYGKLVRYGSHDANIFLEELSTRVEAGWLPYLALEKRPQDECLLLLCDEGQTKGSYLPVDLGVQMAVQICATLAAAHARNVVYRDHKILHYYWDPAQHKISIIDWNVAKWHPNDLSEAEIQADLVQFGARALHHILTGRPAPGALPVGPTRPDEIEMAPHSYSPAWTYDDSQRLSLDLQNILSELLSGTYTSAAKLGEDLRLQLSFADQ